jgi:hypothetical protein
MSDKLPLKSELDSDETTALSTERMPIWKMQQNSLQESDIIKQSERIHDPSSPQIKSTSINDPGSVYLLECIKLHQASIK